MKWAAALLVLAAAGGGTNSCATVAPEPPDTSCGEGKGHWIEDDNGVDEWLSEEQNVRVRLCIDDGGNVIDMEVD